MRYLRKETAYMLDSKIIIPECMRRISNFGRGSGQMVYVTSGGDFIVISTIATHDALGIALDDVYAVAMPHSALEILAKANMPFPKVVVLYLLDLDTIKVYPLAWLGLTSERGDSRHKEGDIQTETRTAEKTAGGLLDNLSNGLFIAENKHELLKIHLSDIYYFEKIKSTHNICIVFNDGISIFKSNLQDVLARLDGGFVQCHKAFIANMTNVRRIEKQGYGRGHSKIYTLHFDDNQSCPCSYSYRKGVLNWTF